MCEISKFFVNIFGKLLKTRTKKADRNSTGFVFFKGTFYLLMSISLIRF